MTPPLRIALISTACNPVPPSGYGGIELVVHELAEGLVARGHAVTLFATGDSRTSATLRFLHPEAQWPPDAGAEVAHACWAIKAVLTTGPFDVAHIHSFAALTGARYLRCPTSPTWAPFLPVVYTLHNNPEDERGGNCHRSHPWVRYVAISEDQRCRMVGFGLGELELVHHGLDPARYECTARPADYVCFIGRFTSGKGPHIAIDVAARAGLPIRVAGRADRPWRAWAEREMTHRLAMPHVTYLGSIGATEKRLLLRDARAFLAPIGWFEPFGLTLIEAMLSGCPVIAFGLGSAPELVEDGITGFVVASPSEMGILLRPGGKIDRFDRLRCRARAVERFARDRMVAEYEGVYARAVRDHEATREAARRHYGAAWGSPAPIGGMT